MENLLKGLITLFLEKNKGTILEKLQYHNLIGCDQKYKGVKPVINATPQGKNLIDIIRKGNRLMMYVVYLEKLIKSLFFRTGKHNRIHKKIEMYGIQKILIYLLSSLIRHGHDLRFNKNFIKETESTFSSSNKVTSEIIGINLKNYGYSG